MPFKIGFEEAAKTNKNVLVMYNILEMAHKDGKPVVFPTLKGKLFFVPLQNDAGKIIFEMIMQEEDNGGDNKQDDKPDGERTDGAERS